MSNPQVHEWKEFGSFTGDELLSLEIKPREWLVEKILREKDSVILVGNEKSGKSVLTFQLICSLTSQHPFIDKYKVNQPCRVTYVQLEGEKGDSQDRMKRMIRALDLNASFLHYMFYPPLELQDRGWAQGFIKTIEEFHNPHKPQVVIIDPIYFAFTGSLSDDAVVRQFIGNIRILKERLGCAVILLHHTHKTRFTTDGFLIDEGDDVIFGSRFLKAWADHILLFTYDKRSEIRTISCTTQRSGDIVKECRLKLVEPDPLYFEEAKGDPTKDWMIVNLLQSPDYYETGLTIEEIMLKLEMKSNTFYNSIKRPLTQGIIVKTVTRPVVYKYNPQSKREASTVEELEDVKDDSIA